MSDRETFLIVEYVISRMPETPHGPAGVPHA